MKIVINGTKSGQYMVKVKAGNGEILVISEEYTTKQSAKHAVDVLQEHAWCAPVYDLTKDETPSGYHFEIDNAKGGQFMTRFRAKNGEIIVWSERYTAKHNAEACAENIRQNIRSADVVDETRSKAA
jgi:uncharacterized protein YegP (UPF0339 family)